MTKHFKNTTYETVNECLDYNPETGVFKWKKRLSGRTEVGSTRVGTKTPSGNWTVTINGHIITLSRIAVMLMERVDSSALNKFRVTFRDKNSDNLKFSNLKYDLRR